MDPAAPGSQNAGCGGGLVAGSGEGIVDGSKERNCLALRGAWSGGMGAGKKVTSLMA